MSEIIKVVLTIVEIIGYSFILLLLIGIFSLIFPNVFKNKLNKG